MEFRNLTPFSVMQYAMDDKHNERHCVVAMKTGFRLKQDENGKQGKSMGKVSLGQLARAFYGDSRTLNRITNWVKINVEGLTVTEDIPGQFRIVTTEPLDVSGRIIDSGSSC
ncbi:hypothetical protein [Escherichia sp. MOD1-EC7003]|uniref:hypothetical protein n=1 Tax=Escherichia sp. MOD1-EC7003 TaxID=2093900 RepID=UPI0018E40C3A|nr:hypothetical protein [Escherichia sp. MOD1-EC7003]